MAVECGVGVVTGAGNGRGAGLRLVDGAGVEVGRGAEAVRAMGKIVGQVVCAALPLAVNNAPGCRHQFLDRDSDGLVGRNFRRRCN